MKLFLSFVVVICILQPLDSQAQQDKHKQIGFLLSFNLNKHAASFTGLPDIPSCCPQYKEGTGSGYAFGFIYGTQVLNEFQLESRLLYTDLSADLEETELLVVNLNNQPFEGKLQHLIEADIRTLTFELLLAYSPLRHITISLGPGISVLLVKDYRQSENIIEPEHGVFVPEGSRTRNEMTGTIPNSTSALISGIAEIRYSILLDRTGEFSLDPFVNYVYTFSNIVDDLTWKPQSFRVGVSIRKLL